MLSLKADFDELMERVRQGRELGHASFEPIFYLVFPPKMILDVKRALPAWTARLRNEGWEVHFFSIAKEIAEILGQSRLRNRWITADRVAPLAWQRTNQALSNALDNGGLRGRLERLLDSVATVRNALVVVTDLEALHPYQRIGAIEGQLYGKFRAPTIFLYPGERAGKTQLKFLGFYPADGNYRSVHVGG